MQDPTDPAEASIPPGNGRNVRRMSGTMRRKVGKRTMPIPSSRQHPVSPPPTPTPPPPPSTLPPLQDEDAPAAKRPRLETLFFTDSDSVSGSDAIAIQIASQKTTDTVTSEVTFASIALSMTAAAQHQQRTTTTSTANNINHLTATPPPTQKVSFTLEDDNKLTRAVKQLGCKDWVAVAALVPLRTSSQCHTRWERFLEGNAKPKAALPKNYLPLERWTMQEDAKLTAAAAAAVQKYGDKKWVRVAREVPGRTRVTCRKRWVMYLGATDRTTGRWTAEEDAKLASAIRTYGSPKRNWVAISAVVQSRTPTQCYERLVLVSETGEQRRGKWTKLEDVNLTYMARAHDRNWQAVAPLILSRTNDQCRKRWAWMNACEHETDREFTAE
jgi:hypothetical protein